MPTLAVCVAPAILVLPVRTSSALKESHQVLHNTPFVRAPTCLFHRHVYRHAEVFMDLLYPQVESTANDCVETEHRMVRREAWLKVDRGSVGTADTSIHVPVQG